MSVQQPVLCPVVSPVAFVLNVRVQSQKKDGSPSSRVKTEINFVKSVFSVITVFVPPMLQMHDWWEVVSKIFRTNGPSWAQIRK